MRALLLILAASFALSACGLKGGLYLPPPKPKPAASQSQGKADEDSKPKEAVPPP